MENELENISAEELQGLLSIYHAGEAYMSAVDAFRAAHGYELLESINQEIEYASDKSVLEAMSTLEYDLEDLLGKGAF